jgi:hypothetical protein
MAINGYKGPFIPTDVAVELLFAFCAPPLFGLMNLL